MGNKIELRPPYLLFIGDMQDRTYAKTAFGLVHWRRNLVAGQLRLDPKAVDLGVPDMDVDAAVRARAGSLVIGVATIGGVIPDTWWEVIHAAARAGLDIVSGLHGCLADNPELVAAADGSGARLIDVRLPPKGLPVGTGRKRTGKRVLMVGTDCAVGKKYSALSLNEALLAIGVKSTFRATGQTGIMIAGEGIPIDAVVADFVSGAAELLSPDNDDDHWDVIEGQGSLFHPGYAGVSLGLLHGSQPDAIVVCHDATRTTIAGWPDFDVPSVADCIDLNLTLGRRTNPDICCVGVTVNTSGLPERARKSFLEKLSTDVGLPCVDPIIDGCAAIASQLAD
jgi:D-glutamate N-acetyltransferase